MAERALSIWRRVQPLLNRMLHIEAIFSLWQFIRSVWPFVITLGPAVAIVIWQGLTGEWGPLAFVLGLATLVLILHLRNLLRTRTDFDELKALVTKPPEIQIKERVVEPSDYGWFKRLREKNSSPKSWLRAIEPMTATLVLQEDALKKHHVSL